MPRVAWISVMLAVTLLVLAGMHLYWALGGTLGKTAAVPEVNGERLFVPSRGGTLAVAAALAAAAGVALAGGGLLPVAGNQGAVRIAAAVLGIVFALRAIGERKYVGFFKRVKGTRFARLDSWLFAPLCLMVSVGFLVLCVG